MGTNGPPPIEETKFLPNCRCRHCGRDNGCCSDLTCPGCGAPTGVVAIPMERPTSPSPPRPINRYMQVKGFSASIGSEID